ncbi:hypothetical protein DFS34DRAFT_113536 [Phlyctochytrium arcticum]|nr:hypothetical protein DFS34DRAFT_113536 [Phlyctochytrium arcticum]
MSATSRPENARMLRPLGILELYELTRSIVDPPFYGNVFGCVHLQTTATTLNFTTILYHGLSRLAQRYPTLLTTVCEPCSTKPYWAWLDQVDWTTVVRQVTLASFDSQEVDAFISQELDDAVKSVDGGPLWRVTVVTTDKLPAEWLLAVSFNHCLMDGSSGRQFLISLLDAMNEVETLDLPPVCLSITNRPSTIPLGFEQRTTISPTFFNVLPHLLPTLRKPVYWAGLNPCEHKKQRSVVRTLSLPLQTLVVACKREKTTVHAALHTLAARTLTSVLGQGTKLVIATPVNPRRFCDKPGATMDLENELGNAFSSYSHKYEIGDLTQFDSSFWQEARDFRSALSLNTPEAVLEVMMLKYLPYPKGMISYYLAKLKNRPMGRDESTMLSNVGLFVPKENDTAKLKMRRAWFAQSPLLSGPAFSMNACSAGDTIQVCLVSEESALGDTAAFLKLFADVWQQGVDIMLQDPSDSL